MQKKDYGYVTYRLLNTEQEKADAVKDILDISFKYQKEVRIVCKVEDSEVLQRCTNQDLQTLDALHDAIWNRLDYLASKGKGFIEEWVSLTWHYCRTRHVEDHAWSLENLKRFCELYINTPDYDFYQDLVDSQRQHSAAYMITYLGDALEVVYHALKRRLNDEASLL